MRAVQADSLFMIAVPMLVIGLAAVIAGPLLFRMKRTIASDAAADLGAFLFGASSRRWS